MLEEVGNYNDVMDAILDLDIINLILNNWNLIDINRLDVISAACQARTFSEFNKQGALWSVLGKDNTTPALDHNAPRPKILMSWPPSKFIGNNFF